MEKRLNKKLEQYLTTFKNDIRLKITELDFSETEKINELMSHIFEYQRLSFDKEDVNKRQRVKNVIPNTNRRSAMIANGEQCIRQRKDNNMYCGTHEKGRPHGVVGNDIQEVVHKKCQVVATEIDGIIQYLDTHGNIYKTEDVLSEKENPSIIGKYTLDNKNKYTIQFN